MADPAPPPYDGNDLLSIIRMLPDVVFRCVKKEDGKIYWTFNEGRLAEEFHLTTAEVRGKSLDELFPGGASSALHAHFEEAFQGRPNVFINEIEGRFFKHFPQPVFDANGDVESVVGFITEVTETVQAQELIKKLNGEMMTRVVELNAANEELKAANASLARANQDLDAFAHTVSHDLRSPLTVIQNVSHVLQVRHQDALGDSGKKHVQKIQRAATRMEDLIADILRFSRASRTALERRDVDLSAMAQEVAEALALGDPGRAVQWEIQPGLHADGDPGLLRTALENLLGNAWKYTRDRDPARIALRSETRDQETFFVVEDNGIGFSPNEAKTVFDAFQRLEGGDDFPGTGIGLATVKRIVERHGGRVEASGATGDGATFRFSLPAQAEGDQPGATAAGRGRH